MLKYQNLWITHNVYKIHPTLCQMALKTGEITSSSSTSSKMQSVFFPNSNELSLLFSKENSLVLLFLLYPSDSSQNKSASSYCLVDVLL